MRFVDFMQFAEELAAHIEDLTFSRLNNKCCLTTARANLNIVKNWLSENNITNVKFHIKGQEVKLYLS